MSQDNHAPNSGEAATKVPPKKRRVRRREVSPWERIVALIVAVWIIALVSYLILQPGDLSEEKVYFLKILLSLSCAILAGTLPGYLNLAYDAPGLVIRAGGALAIFVFVYTQSPAVPQLHLNPRPAVVSVGKIKAIDFRSYRGPAADVVRSSPVAITVPVSAQNVEPNSVPGVLKDFALSFDMDGHPETFLGWYFVEMDPGPGGTWLSSKAVRPAGSVDVNFGTSTYQEVMLLSKNGPNWGDFVKWYTSRTEAIRFNITMRDGLDNELGPYVCVIDNPARLAKAMSSVEVGGKAAAMMVDICA